jgi:DNA-binding beta-propeller fold protein YncE
LRKLERKYARELVVVGVHSPKFPGEHDTAAVEHAVRRLAVGHPVANDRDFRVWRAYAARAWPTLMFLDPRGKVIGFHEGEFDAQALDTVIGDMVAAFDAEGLIDRRPLSFTTRNENEPDRPLFFPGKVLADEARRLFVADSGHHRVLEVGLPGGEIKRVFGSGEAGLQDGPADAARFHGPQGMALAGDALYVADVENHAVRRIDLKDGRVETVAGTGEPGRGPSPGGPARGVALRSPWDVVAHDGQVYVAMAGSHQIWRFDPAAGTIAPWAGSGRENIVDGPRAEAQFAQPSGLALDAGAGVLFVADSEVSGVRAVELGPGGRVRTLVGKGLFEFGDVDGVGDAVRLQHPLGLALAGGVLYVADSYNHKIKRLDPKTGEVRSVFGDGRPGFRDGPAAEAQFSEPGGVTAAGGVLYVADTNNHAVRVCDLERGVVRTLRMSNH